MGNDLCCGFGDRISPEAAPLTRLQMPDISRMHEHYLRLQTTPGIGAAQFHKIFVAVRGQDREGVFKAFARSAPLPPTGRVRPINEARHEVSLTSITQISRCDINDIIAVAILTSTAFAATKASALFELFDCQDPEDPGYLSFAEVVMLMETLVRGLACATRGTKATSDLVESYARRAFDVTLDRRVSMEDWLKFCATAEPRALSDRFSLRGAVKKAAVVTAVNKLTRGGTTAEAYKRSIGADKIKRSVLSQHPLLQLELKKELKLLRAIFDSIDSNGSGEILIEEFISANQKSSKDTAARQRANLVNNSMELFTPAVKSPSWFHEDAFRKMDLDGDGYVSWKELVTMMYHKYGGAVVEEMAAWDLSPDKRSANSGSSSQMRKQFVAGPDQFEEARALFQLYDAGGQRKIPVSELATAMADLHGLDEGDLLKIFVSVGKDVDELIDADGYVKLFQELLIGDDGMSEILSMNDILNTTSSTHTTSSSNCAEKAHLHRHSAQVGLRQNSKGSMRASSGSMRASAKKSSSPRLPPQGIAEGDEDPAALPHAHFSGKPTPPPPREARASY